MDKVKPCPLCGKKAEVKSFSGMFTHGWVGCPTCSLYIQWKIDPAGAVKKWNRRTQKGGEE